MKRLALLLMLALAACGGPAETPAPPSPEAPAPPAAEPDTGFSALLEGAFDTGITGSGYYACTEPAEIIIGEDEESFMLPGYQQISSGPGEDVIQFILPRYVGPGTYDLASPQSVDAPGLDFTAEVLLAGGMVFDGTVSGTLTLEQIPTAAGQQAVGSFDFAISSGVQSVLVVGDFRFTTGDDSSYCEPPPLEN